MESVIWLINIDITASFRSITYIIRATKNVMTITTCLICWEDEKLFFDPFAKIRRNKQKTEFAFVLESLLVRTENFAESSYISLYIRCFIITLLYILLVGAGAFLGRRRSLDNNNKVAFIFHGRWSLDVFGSKIKKIKQREF